MVKEMNKKYHIDLTESERKYVHGIKGNKELSSTVRKRAEIILLADESVGQPAIHTEIASRVGVTKVTVYHTLKSVDEIGLEKTLCYRKPANAPRPAIVTGEIEARIIATACGEPPKGYSRWTVRMLTEKLIELEIFTGSRETVRRTLKKLNLNLI
jgi:transposase